jgi:hypothetical protein
MLNLNRIDFDDQRMTAALTDQRRQLSLTIISGRLHGSSEMISSAEKIMSSGTFRGNRLTRA